MTAWVTGSLEAVAISAAAALLLSALVSLVLPRVDAIQSAARRADAAFLLGLIPSGVAVASWVALMLPSLLHGMGLRADHCDQHSHHAHLCALHFPGHNVELVALGVLAVGALGWRAVGLARAQWRSTRLLSQLEALGRSAGDGLFPVVSVPGSPWLCVAAGAWRRRVVVSSSLADQMAPRHVTAVLEHEYAHLTRNDPAMKVALAWAGLFALPVTARAVQEQFSDAAEQASDAQAAQVVGPLDLAESLVAVARIIRFRAPATGLAFAGSSLERRVATLLHGVSDARPSRGARLAVGLALVCAAAIPLGADTVHHTVETLLGFFQ